MFDNKTKSINEIDLFPIPIQLNHVKYSAEKENFNLNPNLNKFKNNTVKPFGIRIQNHQDNEFESSVIMNH